MTENPPEKRCVPYARVCILRSTKAFSLVSIQTLLSLSGNHRKYRTRSQRVSQTWAAGGRGEEGGEENVREKDLFPGPMPGSHFDRKQGCYFNVLSSVFGLKNNFIWSRCGDDNTLGFWSSRPQNGPPNGNLRIWGTYDPIVSDPSDPKNGGHMGVA